MSATSGQNDPSPPATTFNNYFVNSAVCTPSRACIITGRYPHAHGAYKNGVELNRDEVTLARLPTAIEPGERLPITVRPFKTTVMGRPTSINSLYQAPEFGWPGVPRQCVAAGLAASRAPEKAAQVSVPP